MTLRYDFDIADQPEEESVAGRIALFRFPATAEALHAAPDYIRGIFQAAGFGLETHDSGAGAGRYPARHEAARNQVIDRLSQAMAAAGKAPPDMKRPGPGEFDIGAFLAALVRARPAEPASQAPTPASRAAGPSVPTKRPAAARRTEQTAARGLSLGGAAGFRRILGALALSGFAIGWMIG